MSSRIEGRIEYLEILLKGRAREYEVFGATQEDLITDLEYRKEIEELKLKLKYN